MIKNIPIAIIGSDTANYAAYDGTTIGSDQSLIYVVSYESSYEQSTNAS